MVKLGKYKHYKGDTMEVIGEALHSETLEKFVVYKHITGKNAKEKHYWVRPLKMFMEDVKVDGNPVKPNGHGARKMPRFKYLKK